MVVHKTQNTTLLANLFTCPRFIQFALHEFFLNWFPGVPKLHPLLEEVLHTVSLLSHSPEFALCPSLVTLNCSQPRRPQVTCLEQWPLAHWVLCGIPRACCPVGSPSATDHGPWGCFQWCCLSQWPWSGLCLLWSSVYPAPLPFDSVFSAHSFPSFPL